MPEPHSAESHVAGPEEQISGRERLRRAFLRPSRAQAVVAVLLALVGFAGVTQVRFTNVDNTYASFREQDLIDVLNGLAGTTQRAESEVARLQRTRDELLSDTGARDAALAQAQQEADTLAVLAGQVPVTGPGIRITVTEEAGTVDVDAMVNLIQERRTAGAEAIQFNGEARVVAQTAFEDAVGGVLVGGTTVTSPYVIDVIGEPSTLAGAVNFPNGPRDQFESAGAVVTVDELAALDIQAVVRPRPLEYAEAESTQ